MTSFKICIAFFFAIILSFQLTISAHDVHISYCQVTLENNVLKGRVTYYRDDFERALVNWSGNRKLTGDEHWQAKLRFLKEKFQAKTGNNSLWMNITGSAVDDTSIWFDFAFTGDAIFKSITLEHTTLFSEYSDQMNIIGIKTPGKELSHIFTPSKKTVTFHI